MKKTNGFTKKYVILNSFQDLISGRPCDPEINSGRRKRGFTLAEVLITLGIVGMVAEMTIPTLMKNVQNEQYVISLKKSYTVVNSALKQIASDNGCVDDLTCVTTLVNDSSVDAFGDEFASYFNVVKNCGTTIDDGCFPARTNQSIDGRGAGMLLDTSSGWYRFVTADGVSIGLFKSNPAISWASPEGEKNVSPVYGTVLIDVNGRKKPNIYGRDTFNFYITNGGGASLYPYGGKYDNKFGDGSWWNNGGQNLCFMSNTMGAKNGSSYCTGRVMEEGWEMNY